MALLMRVKQAAPWIGVLPIGAAVWLSHGTPQLEPTAGQPQWISFNAPEGYGERTREGLPVVRGFLLGYFEVGSDRPAWTFEVDQTNLPQASGRSIRLPVPRGTAPGGKTYVIRVKTLGAYLESGWSEPSERFFRPEEPNIGKFHRRRVKRRR